MAAGSYTVCLCWCGPCLDDNGETTWLVDGSPSRWGIYSPKRAGVRRGVMGASSFLPGVQIFTALKERKVGEMSVIHWDNMHDIVQHAIL